MGIVAIIPAKKQSTGLPGKNLRLLAGKPLLAHTILAAQRCPHIDEVIVTTEDDEVSSVSRTWGAGVIARPRELATDDADLESVVKHALHALKTRHALPEDFVLLQPTSPLRTCDDLTGAIECYRADNSSCLISVTETQHHPFKCLTMAGETLAPLFEVTHLSAPRQKLPKLYRQNGAIYLVRTEKFLRHHTFFIPPVKAYFMPPERSVDIDGPLDLSLCEILLNGEALRLEPDETFR